MALGPADDARADRDVVGAAGHDLADQLVQRVAGVAVRRAREQVQRAEEAREVAPADAARLEARDDLARAGIVRLRRVDRLQPPRRGEPVRPHGARPYWSAITVTVPGGTSVSPASTTRADALACSAELVERRGPARTSRPGQPASAQLRQRLGGHHRRVGDLRRRPCPSSSSQRRVEHVGAARRARRRAAGGGAEVACSSPAAARAAAPRSERRRGGSAATASPSGSPASACGSSSTPSHCARVARRAGTPCRAACAPLLRAVGSANARTHATAAAPASSAARSSVVHRPAPQHEEHPQRVVAHRRRYAATASTRRWSASDARQVELAEDRRHVLLDRALADARARLAIARVGAALGHQLHHVHLARGERGQRVVGAGGHEQLRDRLGVERRAALGHAPDGGDEVGARRRRGP